MPPFHRSVISLKKNSIFRRADIWLPPLLLLAGVLLRTGYLLEYAEKGADISDPGAVSVMKSKMNTAITCHACTRREEYLELLSR